MSMLAETPALSRARTPRGSSVYLVALARVDGKGFVRPQDNLLAKAILAQHPDLDAFEAAAAGDSARVSQEVATMPDFVERVHRMGWTPLHFAAFGGQTAIALLLLAHGAEVDAVSRNKFANTPLLVSLLTRQGDVARLLVARGANVNFKGAEGVTALHEAATGGDLDVVRLLLDAGADPNARTGKLDDGRTDRSALDFARDGGHADVASLLLSRGAQER
jgi:ankyrin repeat protein